MTKQKISAQRIYPVGKAYAFVYVLFSSYLLNVGQIELKNKNFFVPLYAVFYDKIHGSREKECLSASHDAHCENSPDTDALRHQCTEQRRTQVWRRKYWRSPLTSGERLGRLAVNRK